MEFYFDVLILSIGFVFIFRILVPNRGVNVLLSIFFIGSIMQILFVGYKWQYVPIYLIFIIISFLHIFNIKIEQKFFKIGYYILIIVIYGICVALVYILPVPEFEIENKKYSVGYEEFHVVVSDRKQPKAFYELSNLTNTGSRELLVDVYYPSSVETEPIQLFKDVDTNWGKTVVRYLNRTWGISLPEYLLSHLNLSYFDIGRDLERLDSESPVVIYTHGWAGEKIFATDQLINIASQGYIVIALDHTGLAMFTELPSGTIYNSGSTEASTKVFDVMKEMSIDIEDTLSHVEKLNYQINFEDISIIGHSTGGGSAYLYCQTNKCSTLILQDPFFVPIIEELDNIELNTNSYFIYSQDWYKGYEDDNSISEIEVYREYTKNKELAEGFYLTDSAHYDFVAFGIISKLTSYTFLKGPIDYKDSLQTNNYFNIAALRNEIIAESNFLKIIDE